VEVANMRVQRELIDANVDRFGGAGCGEQSDARAKHCTGHRERLRRRPESTRDPKIAADSYGPNLLDPRCRAEQALVSIVRPLHPRRLELQSALVIPQNQLVETCRGGCHGPPRVTLGRKVSGAETPTKRRGAERAKDEARHPQRGALG
jgi:hypothetical protein